MHQFLLHHEVSTQLRIWVISARLRHCGTGYSVQIRHAVNMSQAVLRWCKTRTAEVSECKENFNLTQDIDEDETEEEEEVDDLIQKILRLEQGEMRWPHVRPNDDHEDDAIDAEGGYLCACNVQFHSPPKGFKAEVCVFLLVCHEVYSFLILKPIYLLTGISKTPHSVAVQITGGKKMCS